MEKIETLRLNKDFKRVYSRGKSFVSPLLVLYVLKNRSKNIRVGITTSKKIGNAVKRNRARRLIKESFFKNLLKFSAGYDFVFVARERITKVKCESVMSAMQKLILSSVKK